MRRTITAAVTLGVLGVSAALAVPTSEQTAFQSAENRQAHIAETTPMILAAYAVNTRPDHVTEVCHNNVAVKRNGRVIGRLNKGQTFRMIRPIFGEFDIEPVAYFGFAHGNVNAQGTVQAKAFDCR